MGGVSVAAGLSSQYFIKALTLPQSPGEIIFVGGVGEFCLTDLALIVLLLKTPWFCPGENACCVHLIQKFMGPSMPGHFRLVFTLIAICHDLCLAGGH